MKNPYEILGLNNDAPESDLRARYDELKKQYGEERFLDGESGNEGARKLMELEDAWTQICADLQKKNYSANGDFGYIDSLIKSGNYDEAQKQMDSVTVRTAQWHYFQSIIYYKRDWLTESRKQLVMAVNMEPSNAKYSEALSRLDMVMGNPNANQYTMGQPQGQAQARRGDDMANSLCRCCQAYICLDCLCTCLSGFCQ